MGWVPAQTRLTNFLEQNPHNQEAIGRLFSLAVRGLKDQIDYLKQQPFNNATKNEEALNDVLSLFVKTLEFIVAADGFEWMSDGLSIMALFDLRGFGNAPIITENRKLQTVLADLLTLFERSIIQRPLFQPEFGYAFWAAFATIMKNRPDPMIFLHNLSFPKNIDRADRVVIYPLVSAIAEQYSDYPKTNKDGMPVVNELLTFFRDATEWMLEWDPNLDGVFRFEYNRLAKIQAVILIKLQMYSELEKHLSDTRTAVESDWPEIVDTLRTSGRLDNIPQMDRKRIDAILELPALAKNINLSRGIFMSHNFDKESFDKLHDALLQRNVYFPLRQNRGLPENSWSLFSSNVYVASGSIKTLKDDSSGISELVELARNEEIKNLTALERQIRLNPDNHDLMDIYCEKAAKLLPDEELEQKILTYSRLTHTPPSRIAYSKMHNKDEWSRLVSKAIGEGLLKLNDVPFSGVNPFDPILNPWLNLSNWEDLDPQKNSIDWHAFLKDSVFLHKPYYYFSFYFSRTPIPGDVFIKYLNQAELAGDIKAVLDACRARYDWKKENCKNEGVLAMWERAERKLKEAPLPK